MTQRIIVGDAIEVLQTLDEASINTCITSPPYYGQRDYGTAKWKGGDPDCDHLGKPMPTRAGFNERYFGRASSEGNKQDALREPFKHECGKCGAKRCDAQLGLEATPEEYVEALVAVFREVRRVLRDDGTVWLNLGDSYAGSGRGGNPPSSQFQKQATNAGSITMKHSPIGVFEGIKQKDLIGIPWRVAFALQADGWYLRNDIIWAKPNCMPESVRDRCTKSHEYIFLLAKSKRYYYDHEAIKEPVSEVSLKRAEYGWDCDRPSTKNASMGGEGIHTKKMGTRFVNPSGKNKRDVWTVTAKPFKGAHFATFPPDLIEPCVLAGCPPGGITLDPFAGSGTVGGVASYHGRRSIMVELNTEYARMMPKRFKAVGEWMERRDA